MVGIRRLGSQENLFLLRLQHISICDRRCQLAKIKTTLFWILPPKTLLYFIVFIIFDIYVFYSLKPMNCNMWQLELSAVVEQQDSSTIKVLFSSLVIYWDFNFSQGFRD